MGLFGSLGKAAGTIAGTYFGGPAGGKIGGKIGGTLGGSLDKKKNKDGSSIVESMTPLNPQDMGPLTSFNGKSTKTQPADIVGANGLLQKWAGRMQSFINEAGGDQPRAFRDSNGNITLR